MLPLENGWPLDSSPPRSGASASRQRTWWTRPGSVLLVLLLGAAGCRGSLTFGGDLWPLPESMDDDDSAPTDDDDSAPIDDDDSAIPGDDDDATGPGGPVFCGPEVVPGPEWSGQAVAGWTGDATVTFEHEARGGFFAARWTRCEAKHFFDASGSYVCGVVWSLVGDSYGEQYQDGQLVSRFSMEATVTTNTCSPTQTDVDRAPFYFRLTVPEDQGVLDVRWSTASDTNPSQMLPWLELPWDGAGEPRPDEVSFLYTRAFAPGVGAP